MGSIRSKYLQMRQPPITKYELKKTINDDTWNKIPNGDISCEIIVDNIIVGNINYRIGTGQIGIYWLEEKYRNRGLGKKVLLDIMNEINNYGTKECWAVSTQGHYFWSNVFNKSFRYKDPVHKSVTGMGYFINSDFANTYQIANN